MPLLVHNTTYHGLRIVNDLLRVAVNWPGTMSMRLYETCHTNLCDIEDSLVVADEFVKICLTNNCKSQNLIQSVASDYRLIN